ncbi:hypothetical protein D8Y22_07960 [Salinadaptatus halalkaliphilus]|uniref:Nucleotidyltransferase family protein n=1 Tax=Salinadaptatus halalkaliphilus TaxID=2419781 RepID=A0A4S3TRD5_9EURY|nr:nucleotidyltransferase family protein [Salinadaptatus halalkaliphilus]THE65148.1 hypothetical protein D8Y22_07960 [Salinadaptatus halalkaliphilus]
MGGEYSAAEEFIIECTRAAIDDRTVSAERFQPDLEWDTVVELAAKHGIRPIVLAALETGSSSAVPPDVLETLQAQVRLITQRNLRLLQEVESLSTALRDAGIRAIPYRGPVASEIVFRNVGWREFGDVDLLVPRADIPAATSILRAHGYEQQYVLERTDDLTDRQRCAYARFSRDYAFEHSSEPFEVELHWRIVSQRFPTAIRLESVWDRRSTLSVAGTDVPVLAPEDRLLTLCVHGTRHRWERLVWLCDVGAYLSRQSFDWTAVLQRARSHHCERMLYLGLAIANELFDGPLPDRVRRAIEADSAITSLKSHVYERLFDDQLHWYLDIKRYQARTLERRRDRAAFWLKGALIPDRGAIELVSLPRPLFPLYSAVRCLRIGRAAADRLRPGGRSRVDSQGTKR